MEIRVNRNKQMHNFLLRIIMTGFVLSIISCGIFDKPGKIVGQYLSALTSGNFEKAKGYLSEEDKRYYSGDKKEIQKKILVKTWQLTEWKVLETKMMGDKAIVKISVKTPNVGELYGKNIAFMFHKTISDESHGDIFIAMQGQTLAQLNKGEFNYINTTQDFNLIHEGGTWKISLDSEKQMKIRRLLFEANKSIFEKKYDRAKGILEEILSIDKNNSLANYILEKITKIDREQTR